MRFNFSAIKDAIIKIVTSTPSNILIASLGTVASVGGFILAFHTFIDAIDSEAKIYAALIAPAAVFGIVVLNSVLKDHFFTKTGAKFNADKQAIDAAYEHLNKDALVHSLNHDFPDSYQQILTLMNSHERAPITPYTTNVEVANALMCYLEDKKDLTWLVKYSTGGLDLVLAATSGAGTVFINFILPMIFKNALENQILQKIAVAIAVPYGTYTATASLGRTIKNWDEWERKKAGAEESVRRFCEFYFREPHPNEGENAEKMIAVMNLWAQKNRAAAPVANEVHIPMPQRATP